MRAPAAVSPAGIWSIDLETGAFPDTQAGGAPVLRSEGGEGRGQLAASARRPYIPTMTIVTYRHRKRPAKPAQAADIKVRPAHAAGQGVEASGTRA
jgi:hypothetical protein